jgi:hypothetical protein
MPDQPSQSLFDLLVCLGDSRREIARIHSEVEAAVVISCDTLAQSVELLAKASEVLLPRAIPSQVALDQCGNPLCCVERVQP